MTLSKGFPPVITSNARVLILGTLPGTLSLARGEYYAHPRNAFWRLIGAIFGVDPALPYAERAARLSGHGVGLWDVCAAAARPGSLDASIDRASIIVNDFAGLFERTPGIRLICHNGAASDELYRRLALPMLEPVYAAIARLTLPSTSPAHATLSFDAKCARWRAALDIAV